MLKLNNQEKLVSERQQIQDGTIRDSSQVVPSMEITLTFKLALEVLMDLKQDRLTVIQMLSNIATTFSKMITGSIE